MFHHIAYDCSCADWDELHDNLRDVPWEDIFKVTASAAACEFCKWVRVGIDVYIFSYIPSDKYQAKPHLPPWFSAACAATIVHRNHLFGLYGQNQPSKVKFRQASNCRKQQKYICCISYLQQPARRYSLLHLIKQNYLLKNFL